MVNLSCPVSKGCPRAKSIAGLTAHVKAEHPGSFEKAKPILSSLVGQLLQEARVKAREGGPLIHPRLEDLYHDCPCGNSYAWHVRQAKIIRGRNQGGTTNGAV